MTGISDEDYQRVYDKIAINGLIKALNDLHKEIKSGQIVDKEVANKIGEYTKTLSSVPNGTYNEFSDEQKKAIDDINALLPQIGQFIRKKEQKAHKIAQKNGTQVDPGAMNALESVTRAVVNTASYLKAYLKSPSTKTGAPAPGDVRAGTRDANKKVTEQTRGIEKTYAIAVSPIANGLRKFTQSFTVKPQTLNKPKVQEEGSSESFEGVVDKVVKGFVTLGSALTGFNNAVGQFVGALGSAYSAVAQGFGDMLDDPISGVISVMNGMSSMITASMGFFTSILDTISSLFTSIFSGGKDDKEGGSNSKITAIATAILSIISSLLNAALQSIQAGLQIFTSTLQAVFKLVKKIAFTSPVVKAILELLNLAFTLFFMPFMNSFALVLLPYVLELLDWAVQNGAKYAEWGQKLGESLGELLTADGGILEQVKNLATSFITDFLPSFLELIPDLITFAVSFVSDILKNKDAIINFLKTGFSAFSAMLEAGILSSFLDFGKKTMQWLGNNAPQLVTFIASVMTGMLKIAKFFAGFFGGGSEVDDVDIEGITSKATSLAEAMKEFQTKKEGEKKDDTGNQTTNTVNAMLGLAGAASGGKFPCNGGIPVITGEGGEGEYKLSESELKEIGKDTTVSIQYNGQILSKYDFKETVRKALTDVSSKSYYR